MLRALLFDLDDTLYAYGPCNERALEAVHDLLCRTTITRVDEFRALHDAVRGELARELRGQAASHNRVLFFKRMVERLLGEPRPALALALHDEYWRVFLDAMVPAPDAHRVLGKLAARYPLALVSNHTTAVQLRKLVRLDFGGYFRAVVTSEEAGVEKPAGAIFEQALEAVGAAPGEALMVGDSVKGDLEGARAAGIACVHSEEFTSERDAAGVAAVRLGRLGELLERLPELGG